MKQNRMRNLALLGTFVLVCGAAVLAGGGAWVSDSGDHHSIEGDVAFFPDGATELNVADLADGETRIIGAGAKQVRVSRAGDAITIHRTDPAEDTELVDIVCQAGRDTCKILTSDENPEQVVILVQQTRQCIDGAGDCDLDLHTISGEHGNQFVIRKRIECAEGETCAEFTTNLDHVRHEGGGARTMVIETLGEHGLSGDDVVVLSGDNADNVIFLGHDKTTLRCPEGDTTMRVEQDDAEQVFLCPKHSQPLEKVELDRMLHRVKRGDAHVRDDTRK